LPFIIDIEKSWDLVVPTYVGFLAPIIYIYDYIFSFISAVVIVFMLYAVN
jgi:hypothetical protein